MTDFICEVDDTYRSACEGLDFYGEYEGKRYCVLHFPGGDKKDDFSKVLQSNLAKKDYDFSGAIFSEGTAEFPSLQFDGDVSFVQAIFCRGANFYRTGFTGYADFSSAEFTGDTTFSEAKFTGRITNFSEAKFSGEETWFANTIFCGSKLLFEGARFSKKVVFLGTKENNVFGPQLWGQFDRCVISKPELFQFYDVHLHPGWFVNTESSRRITVFLISVAG